MKEDISFAFMETMLHHQIDCHKSLPFCLCAATHCLL